jgi:hypothetical protein
MESFTGDHFDELKWGIEATLADGQVNGLMILQSIPKSEL